MPKNASSSAGWRAVSRATKLGLRAGFATAALRAASGGGGCGTQAPQKSREGRDEMRNPKCRCIHAHVSSKFGRKDYGSE